MAHKVQLRLRELHIKFRPNMPGSPHLNGKVERVQQTMWRESYASTDLNSGNLAEELGMWLIHYNYQRIHGSLGCSPFERLCRDIQAAPLWEDIMADYSPATERYHERNYAEDLRQAQLQQHLR
jgi:transposase InsO family protein